MNYALLSAHVPERPEVHPVRFISLVPVCILNVVWYLIWLVGVPCFTLLCTEISCEPYSGFVNAGTPYCGFQRKFLLETSPVRDSARKITRAKNEARQGTTCSGLADNPSHIRRQGGKKKKEYRKKIRGFTKYEGRRASFVYSFFKGGTLRSIIGNGAWVARLVYAVEI